MPDMCRELNQIPEPYATKSKMILKPWHPLFLFGLEWDERFRDVLFTIKTHDILCRGQWIHDVIPAATTGYFGLFPIEHFKDPKEGFDRFVMQFFRLFRRYVRDILFTDKHLLNLHLVPDGELDIEMVALWLKKVSEPWAFWFDRLIQVDHQNVLSLVFKQPTVTFPDQTQASGWFFHDAKGQDLRHWHSFHPFETCGIPLNGITQECRDIFFSQGSEAVESQLRDLFFDKLADGLYKMSFDYMSDKYGSADGLQRLKFERKRPQMNSISNPHQKIA